MTGTTPYRTYLGESQIPTAWYNLRADMPEKPEPMRLPNGAVATHEDLAPVFADALIDQELDDDTAYVEIPAPVREMYKVYRPSPLCRAYNLESALDTPARIYYKFEGNNTSGSHKLNSALAQAYYAAAQGLTTITTETGAGQWGTALAEAAAHYGLDLDVFMVKCSFEQKPFRRNIMETFGATVTPSPSDTTEAGRRILAAHPDSSGSLGTAISEAVERALHVPENRGRYQLGSVLNQVPRRLPRGRGRAPDGGLRGGRAVRQARDHPAGARERPRHPRGYARGREVPRDRRGQDHSLWAHGNGLLRGL